MCSSSFTWRFLHGVSSLVTLAAAKPGKRAAACWSAQQTCHPARQEWHEVVSKEAGITYERGVPHVHLLKSINGGLVALRHQLSSLVAKVCLNLGEVVIVPAHDMGCKCSTRKVRSFSFHQMLTLHSQWCNGMLIPPGLLQSGQCSSQACLVLPLNSQLFILVEVACLLLCLFAQPRHSAPPAPRLFCLSSQWKPSRRTNMLQAYSPEG